jgi:DNA-binding winged helix-turn-helix (wHTH) protein
MTRDVPKSDTTRFAEFELDPAAYALRRGRVRIKLEKVPMELLLLLVANAGALVERREIQTALWDSDVLVEHDPAINTAIRKIRRALEDDAENPRFVETVVGKGYRFIAPVERREWDARIQPRDIEAARPPSQWHGTFPRYCVTRGAQEFVLDSGDNLLGRDPVARIYIDHASVSRRHARISIGSERALLEDLKSRNGTYLDGRRIDGPTEIRHGGLIGLGPITLTFLILSAPASTRPVSGSGSRGVKAKS